MEQIIYAIKKRAWRSLWLAIKSAAFGPVKNVLSVLLSVYLMAVVAVFGAYKGLEIALAWQAGQGYPQFIRIDINPVQILQAADHEEDKPNG